MKGITELPSLFPVMLTAQNIAVDTCCRSDRHVALAHVAYFACQPLPTFAHRVDRDALTWYQVCHESFQHFRNLWTGSFFILLPSSLGVYIKGIRSITVHIRDPENYRLHNNIGSFIILKCHPFLPHPKEG